MYARTNFVLTKFGSCNSDVRNFLFRRYFFRTYCTSFYGSPLWSLSGSHIQRFYCAWRKCVRRVWNVPYNTHCRFVEHLYRGQNIDYQLLKTFVNFFCGVFNNNNNIVSMCAKLSEFSLSVVAANRRLFLYIINSDGICFHNSQENICEKLSRSRHISDQCINTVAIIKELCMIRDSELFTELSQTETNLLITELCTS